MWHVSTCFYFHEYEYNKYVVFLFTYVDSIFLRITFVVFFFLGGLHCLMCRGSSTPIGWNADGNAPWHSNLSRTMPLFHVSGDISSWSNLGYYYSWPKPRIRVAFPECSLSYYSPHLSASQLWQLHYMDGPALWHYFSP